MDDEPKLRAIINGLTEDQRSKLHGMLTQDVNAEMLDELLADIAKSQAELDVLVAELAANTDRLGDGIA